MIEDLLKNLFQACGCILSKFKRVGLYKKIMYHLYREEHGVQATPIGGGVKVVVSGFVGYFQK